MNAKPDATPYLAFLRSPAAKTIFENYGFSVLVKPTIVIMASLQTVGTAVLDLSPEEWTAVALSLRISIVATVCALPFGIALGWLLARRISGARRCSTGWCFCRWCCRRW